MMKILLLAITLPAAMAAPFMTDRTFAIPRGYVLRMAWRSSGKIKAASLTRFFLYSGRTVSVEHPEISADDYQRAEKVIFDAVRQLEDKVRHAIEKEVDTLFHDLEPHEKSSIKQQAKERVQKGAKKVRQKVEDHDHSVHKMLPSMNEPHPFPYAWPKDDPEHRILHAVETAEKALLRAVEEEVITFFPESKHEDNVSSDDVSKQVKMALKQSVEKMDKHVDSRHQHCRQKVLGNDKNDQAKKIAVEDYLRFGMETME